VTGKPRLPGVYTHPFRGCVLWAVGMGYGRHVLRLADSGCKRRFSSERSKYIERAIQAVKLSISGVSPVDSKVFVGSPEEAGTSYGGTEWPHQWCLWFEVDGSKKKKAEQQEGGGFRDGDTVGALGLIEAVLYQAPGGDRAGFVHLVSVLLNLFFHFRRNLNRQCFHGIPYVYRTLNSCGWQRNA